MNDNELDDEQGRTELVAVLLATGLCAALIPLAILAIDALAALFGGAL